MRLPCGTPQVTAREPDSSPAAVGQSECSCLRYSTLLCEKPLQSQLENKLTATCRL